MVYTIEEYVQLYGRTLISLSIKSVFGSECSFSRLAKSQKAQFTFVNEHFFVKRNEENGLYGQTLINLNILVRIKVR